ncbi:MAG: bifunctional glutamate N-acetyltransferase/amino-acid acetyltransferase ArgJ [Dermatophilaceae bacterium]
MSITFPAGFRASGVAAGIKASGKPDVALLVNDGPEHVAAGVFTTNRVEAAPVTWSRQVLADGRADVVILNAGNANACTGPEGFADTHATAEQTAARLQCSAGDVIVCSTGIIGERLPMDKLASGTDLAAQALSPDGGTDAAHAIMTTDTHAKESTYVADGWSVGGMAKGAGMLAPGLATMLVILTTDAEATHGHLSAALHEATRTTFDRIDSDGCMSTNDTVVVLASGASRVQPSADELTEALRAVCADLAQQLIRDAEGAAHDIAICVQRAASEDDALEVARAVARSNLFKCAIFGRDPNWGRIIAAVGTTRAAFDATTLDVAVNGVWVCRDSGVGEDRALVDLTAREVHVVIDLKAGDADVTIWTNDLTHAYVHENSAYTT